MNDTDDQPAFRDSRNGVERGRDDAPDRPTAVPAAVAVGATAAIALGACASDDPSGDADITPDDSPDPTLAPATPEPDALFEPDDSNTDTEAEAADRPTEAADDPNDAADAAVTDDAASVVVAEVEAEVVEQTVVLDGTVEPVGVRSVTAPVSSEQPVTVTDRAAVGDLVTTGDVLVEVSERPVLVLQGEPGAVDRTLTPGDQGDDVAALQRALRRLGQPIPDDELGEFGEATEQAVIDLYAANGYTPGPSAVTPAALEAADADLDAARDALAAAEQRLAEDRALRPDEADVTAARAIVDSAERDLAAARAAQRHEVDEAQWRVEVARAERDRIAGDPESTQAQIDAANLAVLDARNDLDAIEREYRDAVALAADQLEVARIECKQVVEAAEPDPELTGAVDLAELAVTEATERYVALEAAFGPTVPLGEVVFVDEATAIVAAPRAGADRAVAGLTTEGVVVTAEVPSDARVGPDDETVIVTDDEEIDGVVTNVHDDDGSTEVVVEPAEPARSLIGASVDVVVPDETIDSVELVVPSAAVQRDDAGDASVVVVDGDDTESVPVDVVDRVEGWVAIEADSDDRLELGDDVRVH